MLERWFNRLGQWLCAIRGHNMLWHHEPNLLTLECADCGYRSPGWSTTEERP